MFGFDNVKPLDNSFSLVHTIFSRANFEKQTKKKLRKLSSVVKYLFRFISKFGKLHNVRDKVSAYFLEDQIQKTKTDTRGVLELYFSKMYSTRHT